MNFSGVTFYLKATVQYCQWCCLWKGGSIFWACGVWMKNESYGVTTILNESSLAALSYEQVALTTS